MTNDQLAAVLAERVMGWTVGPERFMMSGRRWLPRWRFQPATRLEDAFHLLERVAAQSYTTGAAENGGFWAKVLVADVTGEARESSQARALTVAVARALRLDVPEVEPSGGTPRRRDRQQPGSKRNA